MVTLNSSLPAGVRIRAGQPEYRDEWSEHGEHAKGRIEDRLAR